MIKKTSRGCLNSGRQPQGERAVMPTRRAKSTEFFCKYCHSDWVVQEGRIMMKWTKYDDDENELETVLI